MRHLDIDSYRNDYDRFGACHRCGWTRHLEKINHSRRGVLHADRTCRWVCAECIHDLSASATIHRCRVVRSHWIAWPAGSPIMRAPESRVQPTPTGLRCGEMFSVHKSVV